MKNFSKVIFGCIFTILITYSVQSVDADHNLSGNSIFKDLTHVNIADQKDSEYQIYLQVEVRNAQGQLISISEDSIGRIIPHELTDHIFNENLGKIEIITVDNIKYEKVQYTGMLDMEQLMPPSKRPSHFIGNWVISLCQVFDKHGYDCISPWQANSSFVSLEEDDIVKNYWTILRIVN